MSNGNPAAPIAVTVVKEDPAFAPLHPAAKTGIAVGATGGLVALLMLIWSIVAPFLPDSAKTVVQPIADKVIANKDKIDALEQQFEAWISKTHPVTPVTPVVPIVTPVTPVVPVTPTIAPLTPAEQQAAIDKAIQDALDKWKHAQPPIPPTPVIVNPTPAPGTLKLILTDEQKNAVTSMTVDANTMIQVTLTGAVGEIVWHITPGGSVSQQALPKNLGLTFELRTMASWVSIVAVDIGSGQSVSARITANQGAQPPPIPNVPVVVNPVDPPKPVQPIAPVVPVKRHLFLSVVEDPLNRTADTAIVLSAVKAWNGFRTDGDDYRFYDIRTTEEKGKRAVQSAGALLPALVIHDMDTGGLLTAVALPKTIDGVTQVVKIWQYVGL